MSPAVAGVAAQNLNGSSNPISFFLKFVNNIHNRDYRHFKSGYPRGSQ